MKYVRELSVSWNRKEITPEMKKRGIGQVFRMPFEVSRYLSWMRDSHREILVVVPMNGRNQALSILELFSGGNTSANVDIPEVIRQVLLANACSFIIVHNHVSGSNEPSAHDRMITEKVLMAAKAVEVHFLDHIILGNGFYSFQEREPHLFK